jgi:sugar phosphate permease
VYAQLILVGLPIWFVSGILMVFSPEFGKELGIVGDPVRASQAIMYSYLGTVLGDFLCGFLSQWQQRRKMPVAIFMAMVLASAIYFLVNRGASTSAFYWVSFVAGTKLVAERLLLRRENTKF